MLSCKEVLARHSEFLDGQMVAGDAELWRSHLANCAACARYDRILRKGIGVLRNDQVEPDAEFMIHLRYRLAYEEQRMAAGPVTAGAATSVTVAAVLALAAWLPIMVMSRIQEDQAAVTSTAAELHPTTSEIAWHGSSAIAVQQSASHADRQPSISLQVATPAVAIIEHGYTPLILEAPTAPPSYSQASFTSFSVR